MKTLIITKEMEQYQSNAKKIYEERNVVEIGSVFLGWNLRKGSVIKYTDRDGDIEITNDNLSGGLIEVNVGGKIGQTTRARIATIILTKPVEVYYSR